MIRAPWIFYGLEVRDQAPLAYVLALESTFSEGIAILNEDSLMTINKDRYPFIFAVDDHDCVYPLRFAGERGWVTV